MQLEVDADAIIGVEGDTFRFDELESGSFGAQIVGADGHARGDVLSVAIGRESACDAGLFADDGYRDVGDDAATGIGDRADDCCFLSPGDGRQQREQDDEKSCAAKTPIHA